MTNVDVADDEKAILPMIAEMLMLPIIMMMVLMIRINGGIIAVKSDVANDSCDEL